MKENWRETLKIRNSKFPLSKFYTTISFFNSFGILKFASANFLIQIFKFLVCNILNAASLKYKKVVALTLCFVAS